MAEAFRQKGNLNLATTCLHKALKINPRFAEAINTLGVICFEKGDLNGAKISYQEARQSSRNMPQHTKI